MNKKIRLKLILFSPLILILLGNIIFIFYKLSNTDYLTKTSQILGNYFWGFPLIPFSVVLCVLLMLFFTRKTSLSIFLLNLSIVFILFLIAINTALFPEIHRYLQKFDSGFKIKKEPTLEKAMANSSASLSKDITSYLHLNHSLNNKILLIPSSSPLDNDYFFHAFVSSTQFKKEKYNYVLDNKDLKKLKEFESKKYKASQGIRDIKIYSLFPSQSPNEKLILFYHNHTILFLPLEWTHRLFPDIHV